MQSTVDGFILHYRKNRIYALVGGCGNHIRWLCLLSDKFKFNNGLDINGKLNYILDEIYPYSRKRQNWLSYEWETRDFFDKFILFKHEYDNNIDESVFINVSPSMCLRHYIKFNTQLNGFTISEFQQDIKNQVEILAKHNVYTVNGDAFYNTILPFAEYTQIIEHFGLENNYDIAQVVHTRWFELNKIAENEIGNWFNVFYNTNLNQDK